MDRSFDEAASVTTPEANAAGRDQTKVMIFPMVLDTDVEYNPRGEGQQRSQARQLGLWWGRYCWKSPDCWKHFYLLVT
jgi:hypothetical protein